MRTCLEVERMFPFIKGVETLFALETGSQEQKFVAVHAVGIIPESFF